MSTEKIMEQAQVFASAWSVVGGPFDGGDAMEVATQEKDELKRMVAELVKERDAMAAKLAELERQEPVATLHNASGCVGGLSIENHAPDLLEAGMKLYARPVPAEQHVNARLLSSLNLARTCIAFDRNALVETHSDLNGNMDFLGEQARDEYDQILADIDNAISAAEAQAGPVRLTEADLEECKRLADAGSPVPHMSWSQRLAFAIESAVLERNGLKPQTKGD